MKKVYYDQGPETIEVGPKNKAVKMQLGSPQEFDDETAALLLNKPMFHEFKEDPVSAHTGQVPQGTERPEKRR